MQWMIGYWMLWCALLTGCQVVDTRPFRAPIVHGEHLVIGILAHDRAAFAAGLLQALQPVDVTPETIDTPAIDGVLVSQHLLAAVPHEPALQKDLRQILARGTVVLFANTSPEAAARQLAIPLHGTMHAQTERLALGSLVQTEAAGIIPGRLLIPVNTTLNDRERAQNIRELLQDMRDLQQRFSAPPRMPEPAPDQDRREVVARYRGTLAPEIDVAGTAFLDVTGWTLQLQPA